MDKPKYPAWWLYIPFTETLNGKSYTEGPFDTQEQAWESLNLKLCELKLQKEQQNGTQHKSGDITWAAY